MDESTFNALYAEIAKPLWKYVARVSGAATLRMTCCRRRFFAFCAAPRAGLSTLETRLYLFRIATNLLKDRWRRSEETVGLEAEEGIEQNHPEIALDAEWVLKQLKPRARELLWLAYVEGMSHSEIARVTGLKALSVRILLLRARREARSYSNRKEIPVGNKQDLEFAERLRRLGRVEPSDEIPTAAAVWSRSQFRLRYDSQKRRRSYTSGAGAGSMAGRRRRHFIYCSFCFGACDRSRLR